MILKKQFKALYRLYRTIFKSVVEEYGYCTGLHTIISGRFVEYCVANELDWKFSVRGKIIDWLAVVRCAAIPVLVEPNKLQKEIYFL